MPWSIFEVRFQGVRLVSGIMFPLLLQRHCLSRAEPGAAPRDQLRDGPDALGHCSPLSCQQSWRRRSRPHQSNDVRPLARLKGTSTAGEVRKCSQARSLTRLAVSPPQRLGRGVGRVRLGQPRVGKGGNRRESMIGMQAKIGWEGKNWWVTKLNKLESHRCHTLLGSKLCGAGQVLATCTRNGW